MNRQICGGDNVEIDEKGNLMDTCNPGDPVVRCLECGAEYFTEKSTFVVRE